MTDQPKRIIVKMGDGVIEWYRGVFKVPRTTSCWPCQFARFLLKTGVDPKTILEVRRDGVTLFRDATVQWWAGKTTVENDKQSPILRDYVPFNRGEDS